MKTVPLRWELWLSSLAIAVFTLFLGFLLRLIPVKLDDWEKKAERPIELKRRESESDSDSSALESNQKQSHPTTPSIPSVPDGAASD